MVSSLPNFKEDIICSRSASGIETNVPRRIIRHSPDGFEWGYGGSGPADFALNILSIFIGQKRAQCGGIYQAFKWEFIARLPEKGGTISRTEILNWINENVKE